MVYYYEEAVDDRAPSRSGFSIEGGRATGIYYVMPDVFPAVITDLLGYAAPNGTGGIRRILPSSHPQFPWLYAKSVQIQGMGFMDAEHGFTGKRVNARPNLGVLPITDSYWLYPKYALTVEFVAQPYPILDDASISVESIQWFDDDGNNVNTQMPREWLRFVDWGYDPASEDLTFQQGQMWLVRTDNNIKPPVTNNPPHSYPFPGMAKIYINKSRILFDWFQVPFSFVDHANSFIRKWQGRINQKDWLKWKAGQLLYLTYRVKRYTPPLPLLNDNGGVFSTDKLCDIQFVFEEVTRESPQKPNPAKGNWIAAGHNLHPWQDRKFYYGVLPAKDDENDRQKWRPLWESCPFQLLFRDPGVAL